MLLFLALGSALAGEAEGQVDLDVLHASSRSSEAGSGSEERFTYDELGMRVQGDVHTADDRLGLALDYNGREPVAGNVEAEPFRLLYSGEVSYDVVEDRLTVGAGRFLAPGVVFLPVDGGRVTWTPAPATGISLFGGRRGVTTSRANVPFDTFMPAVGLSADHRAQHWLGAATVGWAEDVANLGTPTSGLAETYGALTASGRATVLPTDTVAAGAAASLAQHATYVLGPLREEAEIEVTALDLFSAVAWTEWRPREWLRLDYDFHHQSASVWSEGFLGDDGALAALVEPNFTDNQVRVAVAPWSLGWVRVQSRLRLRPERTELRNGVFVEANELGLPGAFLRGSFSVDDIISESARDDIGTVDRLFWSASAGWQRDDLDLQAGLSSIERAAVPVSGRVYDGTRPGEPVESDDLSPFVFEAQDIAFFRGFYAQRRWFLGLDAERNLHDAELRVLVSTGVLGAKRW